MSDNSNLPGGLKQENEMFELTPIRTKDCPDCGNDYGKPVSECCGASIDTDILICSDCKEHSDIQTCDTCSGNGVIEMTQEEILESENDKKEKASDL